MLPFILSPGGLAIGVPGELKGFYEAWLRFGRLDWAKLFNPTIKLCEEGFTVEESLANAIASSVFYIRMDPNLWYSSSIYLPRMR